MAEQEPSKPVLAVPRFIPASIFVLELCHWGQRCVTGDRNVPLGPVGTSPTEEPTSLLLDQPAHAGREEAV